MTVQFQADNLSAYITSDLITAYISALPSPDHSLSLDVTFHCGTTYTIALTSTNLDLVENRYVLTPSDVSMEDTDGFSDGVYSFVLTKTVTASGDTTSEYACEIVDQELTCDLITYTSQNLTNTSTLLFLWDLHRALYALNQCAKCNCADGCLIWDRLVECLNAEETSTTGCNGCN